MAQFNGSADNIENNKNKVISISKDSTHEQYPSAKATFEKLKEETAKFISLEDNTEWIFNGGDASGSASVDLVIDDEMSSESDNLVSNKVIKKYIDEKFLSFYRVGSIYMSTNDTSPAFLFGGEWERIEDTFLLACGDSYAAGSTGGKAEHTLTVEQMPSHNHGIKTKFYSQAGDNNAVMLADKDISSEWEGNYTFENNAGPISYNGGSKPHNNMPPYLAVYMWKRTA